MATALPPGMAAAHAVRLARDTIDLTGDDDDQPQANFTPSPLATTTTTTTTPAPPWSPPSPTEQPEWARRPAPVLGYTCRDRGCAQIRDPQAQLIAELRGRYFDSLAACHDAVDTKVCGGTEPSPPDATPQLAHTRIGGMIPDIWRLALRHLSLRDLHALRALVGFEYQNAAVHPPGGNHWGL
jgi:hypothetical protein